MYHACLELFEATSLNGVLQCCVPKDLQGCDWEAYTNGKEMFSGDPSYWGWNPQVVHVYFTAPQFTYTGDRIPRSSCLSLHSRHAAKIAELMQQAKAWTTPPMHGDGWGQSAPTRPLLPYRPWLTKKSALCAMFAFWAGLGIRLSMDPIDSIQSTRLSTGPAEWIHSIAVDHYSRQDPRHYPVDSPGARIQNDTTIDC